MSKVTRLHSRRYYQIIVGYCSRSKSPTIDIDGPGREIYLGHFGKHDRDIFLLARNLANWRGYLGRGENRRCHLIQERLKDMMVPAIDQNDVCVAFTHRPRRSNPGESTANDYYARPPPRLRCVCDEFQRFCHFAHWQTLCRMGTLTLSAAT